MSFLTQIIDHLPDEIHDRARTLVDRIPEGIKRTEDTIEGQFALSTLVRLLSSELLLILGILNPNSEI